MQQFKIVSVEWGNNIDCLSNSTYTLQQIDQMVAINRGAEFSNIDSNCQYISHLGVIVSSNFFNNYSDTVLVAPITTKKTADKESHQNKVILYESDYDYSNRVPSFKLDHDSVILLTKIREIDKSRIKKRWVFLRRQEQDLIKKKLKTVFNIV